MTHTQIQAMREELTGAALKQFTTDHPKRAEFYAPKHAELQKAVEEVRNNKKHNSLNPLSNKVQHPRQIPLQPQALNSTPPVYLSHAPRRRTHIRTV